MILRLTLFFAFLSLLIPAWAASGCFIVGDSIAVGLAAQMPECASSASVGIPARAVVARVRVAKMVVVSAGSNDLRDSPSLRAALEHIRARAGSSIVWVLPANGARRAVFDIARRHGDRTVGFQPGRDGVHPRSYRALARAVRSEMR